MARQKETLWQVDFALGSVRPEAEERDDIQLVERSLKGAKNTIGLSTGQVRERPGTAYVASTGASRGIEVDLGSDRIYDLHINSDGLVLLGSDGAVVYSNASYDWTALTGKFGTYSFSDISFWVVSSPENSTVLIGSQKFPRQALSVDGAGSWTLQASPVATRPSGAHSQGYFKFYNGVKITPSARTGAITLTADSAIWTDLHEDSSVRYLDREILLGTRVSDTVINATVVEELAPTYDIVVAAVSGYKLGDAVEHSVLGGLGIITAINSGTATITVLATSAYDGFDAVSTPKLVAPNAAQVISSVSSASPAGTNLWDYQVESQVFGYAGYAALHKSRLYLCDFPAIPLAFMASAAGDADDFTPGENDGDAFVEVLSGDAGGELKYIVSAEDLLFMTTKGLYYQQTRDGSAVTPTSISPIPFSRRGIAPVEPAVVDDGCVFIDAVGSNVYAAVLGGDVYRSWKSINLTKFHAHLVNSPVHIGATSSGSETAEEFVYITNADGTAAVCQWDRDDNTAAWRDWDTEGGFRAIYQCFGKMHCVADRIIDALASRFVERFEAGVYLDCAGLSQIGLGEVVSYELNGKPVHLEGHDASVYLGGWDYGELEIDASGDPLDANGDVVVYPSYDGILQVGLAFTISIIPWSRRSARTQRGTREVKRLIQLFLTVKATGPYAVGNEQIGAYRADEDLSLPPPLRTEQSKVTVAGRVPFEAMELIKDRPGPFTLLKIGYRVVV